MKKNTIIILIILIELYSFYGYSQTSKVYSTIETKNVIYYEVKEIINMKFGGTTTSYTVSDLSLISKNDLGPNNIRIITPIYKNEDFTRKNYYVETKNLNPEPGANPKENNLTEIKIESKKIEIAENTHIEPESLAIALQNIIKSEPVEVVKPVKVVKPIEIVKAVTPTKPIEIVKAVTPAKPIEIVKNSPTREKVDYININIMDTYERVVEKGYQSIYMYKQLANYFFFKNEMEKAVKWYEALFAMTTDLDPVFLYRFGDALRKTGKTQRGEALIEKFNQLSDE